MCNASSRDFGLRVLNLLLLAAMLVTAASAQVSNTGRIEGTVQDESGAVIHEAAVTATNTRTQQVARATANAAGFFIFPSLPNSTYSLTVEAKGFRKALIANVELNASATVSQIIRMEIGSVAETVTVEASTETVNTSNAQLGRSVTLKDIDTLPALGRSPLTLVVFQPGVSVNAGDVSFANVNGTRQGSNNTKLDGIDANDAVVPRLGLSLTSVNLDSVEEVRMVTNGCKAEYGRNAGGQVEMITRSGTNRWSGNGYDYLRNTKLNANQFFNNSSGVARPKFIQNLLGGSMGGPVRRDRTFIFGNYQGRRTAQETVRNRTVLTPDAKRGLFRWRPPGSQTIESFDIVRNDPRGKGIDQAVAAALQKVPDPNNTDVGDALNTAGFRFNNPTGSYEDQFTIKADHNLWNNHRVFYRHSWQRNSFIDSLNNADAIYPGLIQGTQGGRRWGYSIGSDWTIRPTTINEFRLGYQSASVDFLRPNRPREPVIVPNLYSAPYLTGFSQGRNSPVIDIADNLTMVRGNHTWKAGMTTRRVLQYGYNEAGIFANLALARASGNVPPAAIGPSGGAISSADRQRFEDLYNDVLGRVSSITQTFYSNLETFQPQGAPRLRNNVLRDVGLFLQDDWKVRPGLTLNIGIRWEYFGSPVERDGFQGTVDRAEQINAVANISNLAVQKNAQWYNVDKNNFAPRFGFAWDPFRSGKTSIRGGYGIYYDRIIGATASLVDGNTPGFSQAVTNFPNSVAGSDVRVSDRPAMPAQPAAPILVQPLSRQTTISIFRPDLTSGYVQHFDLNIQRELFRNTVIDVGFVRTSGVKLFTWLDFNQPRVFGDFLTAFNEIERFRATGTAVSPNNTIARLFGGAQASINAIGASTFQQGLLGAAAETVDRNNFQRYAGAGVSDFYLRNYPQYNLLHHGNNNGTSSFNSLQASLRRQTGALKFIFNYTYSRSLDNTSVDGNGFTAPIDNYNLRLNRGRSDFDRTHAFNGSMFYFLPIGRGKFFGGNMPGWADRIAGGWEAGSLMLWQSGSVFSVSSGRRTSGTTANTLGNYSGDRTIGAVVRGGNAVTYFATDEIARFTFPGAGEIGTSGRNSFRGPRFFSTDISIVKRFPIRERHAVTFRAEMYNLFNNVNFSNPGASLATPQSFGRISGVVGSARIMQMALRYDF
ncbi:MAG: TonB-dependent receptor [Acidobacteria bacterium]|nr:TonB-dependent receptor [Acidobacteriota bacterium]